MDSYFSTRRTVRTFSNKDIDDALLKAMLEAAAHAPTTGNMQLYSVVITRDADRKNRLAPAHFSQPAYMNAPVILTFCADLNRFSQWCRVSDADACYDNLQSLVAAALDTTILAQQFVTIAEQECLGTCYLGTTTYNPDQIAEALKLPLLVVPVTTLAVGYPEGEQPQSDRLDVSSFVHLEEYKPYTDDDIRAIYAAKEARDDSKRFVKENNKKNLAQVFTDVRYPRANNEHFSETLATFIKKQLKY